MLNKPASYQLNPYVGIPSGRFSRIILLMIALSYTIFLLAACTFHSPSERPVLNQPETTILDVQSSVAMKALMRVLAEKKFTINTGRTNDQHIETEWLQDGSYRSMVQAEVVPIEKFRSQLKVNLLLQKKSFLQDTWQPMDRIDNNVYKQFMNDVLIESYRVLYDRR